MTEDNTIISQIVLVDLISWLAATGVRVRKTPEGMFLVISKNGNTRSFSRMDDLLQRLAEL